MRTVIVVCCLASTIAASCSRSPRLAADLVITRANVWTGDPLQPAAEAVAIVGDRIADVGSAGDIDRGRGGTTTVLDAGGRRPLPGLHDPRVHFRDRGHQLTHVPLR